MNGRMTEKWMKLAAGLGIAVGLLVLPVMSDSVTATMQMPPDGNRFVAEDEARREAEQDAREREQAKKDADADHQDRMQELYDDGRGYLDEGSYGDAVRAFTQLVQMKGPQTDAAMYWLAYSQNKQGKRDVALSTIGDLKRRIRRAGGRKMRRRWKSRFAGERERKRIRTRWATKS